MKLHEYQVKQLFSRYGLFIPKGYVCTTPYEAEDAANKIGVGPWVIKCQVHAGGRSKAGGIKITKKKEEIRIFAEHWLGKRLITYQTDTKGQLINQILVEEAKNIIKEFYIGVFIDCRLHKIIFTASKQGGIEIEEKTKNNTDLIYKIAIDPLIGPMPYQGREIAFQLGLKNELIHQFVEIFINLITIFLRKDLSLIEINPLVITPQNDLICLDGKIIVDNNALFRQKALYQIYDHLQKDPCENQAAKWKLNYVAMDGNIGCMANGAGLAMSTMDMIKLYGGKPANFLDISGNATRKSIVEALKIILSNKKVQAILINIFGGIVCCNLIAEGIIDFMKQIDINITIVIRLEGNNADLGIQKLINSDLSIFVTKNLKDAMQQVINAVNQK